MLLIPGKNGVSIELESFWRTKEAKFIWSHKIFTHHNIEALRSDIVPVKNKCEEFFLKDIAVPGDVRVEKKEEEKMEKFGDLCRDIRKLWKVECKIVLIVVGALGTLPNRLPLFIFFLEIKLSVETIQKAAILKSTRVL